MHGRSFVAVSVAGGLALVYAVLVPVACVAEDVASADASGVSGTPTFFINGVKVEGALPPQYFDQAIAYELQRATAGK